MKYMLLMHGPVESCEPITTWPAEDLGAHIRFMQDLGRQLNESGELVDAQGLAFPDQARIVTARDGAPPAVTDGPFPESKEFLAGYWVVDVESQERAIEIAAQASAAPGPKGVAINMPIQVREVMSAPGEEM